jgi:hypothetical protein
MKEKAICHRKKLIFVTFSAVSFSRFLRHKIKLLIYFSTSCKLCLAHILLLRSRKVRKKSGQTVPYESLKEKRKVKPFPLHKCIFPAMHY